MIFFKKKRGKKKGVLKISLKEGWSYRLDRRNRRHGWLRVGGECVSPISASCRTVSKQLACANVMQALTRNPPAYCTTPQYTISCVGETRISVGECDASTSCVGLLGLLRLGETRISVGV